MVRPKRLPLRLSEYFSKYRLGCLLNELFARRLPYI